MFLRKESTTWTFFFCCFFSQLLCTKSQLFRGALQSGASRRFRGFFPNNPTASSGQSQNSRSYAYFAHRTSQDNSLDDTELDSYPQSFEPKLKMFAPVRNSNRRPYAVGEYPQSENRVSPRPQSTLTSISHKSLTAPVQEVSSQDQGPLRNEDDSQELNDEQLRRLKSRINRDMRRRKQQFLSMILMGTGRKAPPTRNSGDDDRQEVIAKLRQLHERPPTRHCYVATCLPPTGSNASLWADTNSRTLRLNFPLPRLNRKSKEKVADAKIHLFLKPRKVIRDFDPHVPGFIATVYQFTRRLVVRKGKVVNRTEILDRMSVPLDGNTRVSMRVKSAVKLWMQRPRRNLGLAINIQWLNGTGADANDAFLPPSCRRGNTETQCRKGHINRLEMNYLSQTNIDAEDYLDGLQPILDVTLEDETSKYSKVSLEKLAMRSGSMPINLGNIDDFRRLTSN